MKQMPRRLLVLTAAVFSLVVVGAFWASQAQGSTYRRQAASPQSGTFYDSGQSLGNANSQDVALGNLDGVNGLDAFVANNGANIVWLNNGSATFSSNGQSLGSLNSQDVALGDLDGDFDLDAVAANANGLNQVWTNNGSGQFGAGQAFDGADSRGVAIGNLDGDPGLDVFVANNGANTVWLNNGGGTLVDSGQSLGTSNSYGVALGDLDGDSDLDAFVANGGAGQDPDKVWINQGGAQGGTEGVFQDSGQNLDFIWTYAVALGDLDGDTDLDAFTASWFPPANKVWINNGSGAFSDSGQSLGSSASLGVSLADVDGDGDLDALVANNTPDGGQVWVNQGGDQGGAEGVFANSGQALGAGTTYDLGLGDLDGDADPDAFAANFGPNKVWINGDTGLPEAFFDVDRATNPGGDDVYYWATGGSAVLPVMLGHPYTATADVYARVESAGGTLTETLQFSAGTQIQFLNIVDPMPNPDETVTLTLSITDQGVPPTPADVTDNLLLTFVAAGQGDTACILCYVDWLAQFVGFNPSFWSLHHLDLADQQASPQWAYYTALNPLYSPEMSAIAAMHPSVLWESLGTLEEWMPAVLALNDGAGDTVTVTSQMAADADGLIDAFKAHAEPGLQAFLQSEQNALDIPTLAGMNMDEVWEEFQVRRSIDKLFVTVVLKN